MKNQALFSSKDKSEKLKCHLLQFLFGAVRVKQETCYRDICKHCKPSSDAADRRKVNTVCK